MTDSPAARRRPPHYLSATPGGDEVVDAGSREQLTRIRAWLMRHDDEAAYLSDRYRDDVVNQAGEWSMFLEDGVANETFHGSQEELLVRAVEHGVAEIFMWSSQERDYSPLDPSQWPARP